MRILVAVDGTDISRKAFQFMANVIKPNDEVILLAVAEETQTYMSGPFDPINITALNEINENIRNYMLSEVKARGRELGERGIKHSCFLGKGTAKDTICEEALTHKVDLIILGRRESSGIRRVIHESHSTYVLHHAHCDVLIVKEEFEAHSDKREEAERIQVSDE